MQLHQVQRAVRNRRGDQLVTSPFVAIRSSRQDFKHVVRLALVSFGESIQDSRGGNLVGGEATFGSGLAWRTSGRPLSSQSQTTSLPAYRTIRWSCPLPWQRSPRCWTLGQSCPQSSSPRPGTVSPCPGCTWPVTKTRTRCQRTG